MEIATKDIEEAEKNKILVWNLSRRSIANIPQQFYNLTSLRVLHLNNNSIKSISSSIEKLQSLEILDLSSNRLQEIPPELGNLRKLKVLMLYNNSINDIPYTIGGLVELEVLSVGYILKFFCSNDRCNNLNWVPIELNTCKKLKKLSLNHNRLTAIDNLLEWLVDLEELNISQNKIQFLPSNSILVLFV